MSAALGLAAIWSVPPAGADTRIEKTFDTWKVTCAETEKTKGKRCVIRYALANSKKRIVFSWSMVRNEKGKHIVAIRTPTGVRLPAGVQIGFPGTKPVTLAYKTCGPRLCLAEFEFTNLWLKSFTSRPMIVVGYEAISGVPLKHEVPLGPFKEGYAFFTKQLAE